MYNKNIKNILDSLDIIYNRKNTIDKLLSPDILKFKNIQTILGPSSIVSYKINNRLVLFFEDVHKIPESACYKINKTKDSIWITDFLKELFVISPTCIDFFHETATFMQLSKEKMSFGSEIKSFFLNMGYAKGLDRELGIEKLWKEFADCLGPVKTGCLTYSKVRFHNVEFRRFVDDHYNITAFDSNSIFGVPFFYMYLPKNSTDIYPDNNNNIYVDDKDNKNMEYKRYDDVMKEYIANLSLYKNILQDLLNGDMSALSIHIMDMHRPFNKILSDNIKNSFKEKNIKSSQYPKLAKQFIALDKNHKYISQKIKDFIMEEYDIKIKPQITQLQSQFNQNKIDKKLLIFSRDDTSIRYINRQFAVIIFDAYTLSRMMKSIYVYGDSSIIIMYAGRTHTRIYSRFLEENFGIEKIVKIKNIQEACVNLIKLEKQDKWRIIIDSLSEQFKNNKNCTIKPGIILDEIL